MKYAHFVRLSVFSHEHEDSGQVLESFSKLFPFDLKENKVKLSKTIATGVNEKKIAIFEASITKPSLVNLFLSSLLNNLNENQKNTVLIQAESRLDKNLDFFMRFDKESWMKEGKLDITELGNCFHLKIGIAAFPKKREAALKIINAMFQNKKL